jgi:hypothetical protein
MPADANRVCRWLIALPSVFQPTFSTELHLKPGRAAGYAAESS